MGKKTISFDEMSEKEQEAFFEKSANELKERYKPLIEGLKGVETSTIILESGLGCIIRKPNVQTLKKVMPKLTPTNGEANLFDAGEIILRECWVCGDSLIKENEDMLFAASLQAASTINIMRGVLKKN